jgi:hypothetical protein
MVFVAEYRLLSSSFCTKKYKNRKNPGKFCALRKILGSVNGTCMGKE